MAGIMSISLDSGHIGRPTLLTDEVAEKIEKALIAGNYVKPACEAAGIGYTTLREWIARGQQDLAAGLETPFTNLTHRLARAKAVAETSLVAELRNEPDWRAKGFLLERGPYRDRWGKEELPTKASVTVTLPESLVAVLADALRVAGATSVQAELVSEQAQLPDTTGETDKDAD